MVNYRRVVIKHILPERSGALHFCFFSRLPGEFFSTPRLIDFFSLFTNFSFRFSQLTRCFSYHDFIVIFSLSLLCRLVVVVAAAGVVEEAVEGEAGAREVVVVDVAEKRETAHTSPKLLHKFLEEPLFSRIVLEISARRRERELIT